MPRPSTGGLNLTEGRLAEPRRRMEQEESTMEAAKEDRKPGWTLELAARGNAELKRRLEEAEKGGPPVIRHLIEFGVILFSGCDLARLLGYEDPISAVFEFCRRPIIMEPDDEFAEATEDNLFLQESDFWLFMYKNAVQKNSDMANLCMNILREAGICLTEEDKINNIKAYYAAMFAYVEKHPIDPNWRNGYVYLAQADDTNLYKIGFSRDVSQRIKSLNTAQGMSINPCKVTLIHQSKFTKPESEKLVHELFTPYRKHGEWFEFDSIEEVKNELNKL